MPRKAIVRPRPPAFDGMTREQVDRLTPEEREARRARLLDTPGAWTIRQFAEAAGLSPWSISGLRNNYLNNGGVEDENALPAPDPDINSDDIRKPGQQGGRGSASPLWRPRTALLWLTKYRRIDEDLVPFHRGRKAPGRPPGQRKPTDGQADEVDQVGDVEAALAP